MIPNFQLWILILQILAVHGVTFYLTEKPKAWNVDPKAEATSRINNVKKGVEKNSNFDGEVIYAFDTDTGIYAYQAAAPKLLRTGTVANGVEGSYAYSAPDGTKVSVTYTADENGYHPKVSISRN